MKRAGFTMIELVFVIVILGILAAVAVPKLTATRTDAKVATMAANVATLITDIGTFYTARGSFDGVDPLNITNVEINGSSTSLTNADSFSILDGNIKCIDILFIDTVSGDVNITASSTATPPATGSTVCDAVILRTTNLQKSYSFGSVGIVQ